MKTLRNIQVPTGNILVVQGDHGSLECLSIADYGQTQNIKADFLGLTNEITKLKHCPLMPLTEKWVVTVSTQYGCSMNCVFCLLEDAPILMADYTYKKIKDVNIGDIVISNVKSNDDSPITNYATSISCLSNVTGTMRRKYIGKLYEIITEDGHSITCTDKHPIAVKGNTRNKFMPANEINIGDSIVVTRHIDNDNYSNENWKIGWVLGFTLGDGVYDEIDGRRWMISQKYKDILEYHKSIIESYGIKTTNIWETDDRKGHIGYRYAVQGQNVDAMDAIFNLENQSDDFKRGLIAGFWDAEGYSFQNNQGVRVCNSTIEFMDTVRGILDYFEITYSTYTSERPQLKTMYVLNIAMSRDEFNAIFTPIHSKKNYLENLRSRKFSYDDKVVTINTMDYDGIVYNIETSEHNYYAFDVLTHNCDVPKVGKGLNATYADLKGQITAALELHPEVTATKRLNVHYARMGEPTWNWNVIDFTKNMLRELRPYIGRSIVHPVISTMMPKNNMLLNEFLSAWMELKNYDFRGQAGLQLSINSTNDDERAKMFSGNSLSLKEISDIGRNLDFPVGRKITLNFAVADYEIDAAKLRRLFDPKKFMVKLTPMHKTKACTEHDIATDGDYTSFVPYAEHEKALKDVGFDVLVFIASDEEDLGRITCGNAILSGTMPLCEYSELPSPSKALND